jgi:hypothetical protein
MGEERCVAIFSFRCSTCAGDHSNLLSFAPSLQLGLYLPIALSILLATSTVRACFLQKYVVEYPAVPPRVPVVRARVAWPRPTQQQA